MKTWSLVFLVAATLVVTTAVAQSPEYDDMYFNSKDRQKLKEKQATEQTTYNQTASGRHKNTQGAGDIYSNSSDATTQYSARNQNPEFAARSHSQAAAEDADYFTPNYKYNNVAAVSSFNNSYNNWYNSPWVANNYFGSSIYGWNTPYYGSYYDSWGNPWMNPYYRSGWSSSFSFYMGNGMNYGYGSSFGMGYGMGMGMGMGMGYGMGMGMGMSYMNPYNNSWAGWGNSYGYGGMYAGYPSTVIVNNDNRSYAYGKRGAQNGMVTRRSVTRATLGNSGSVSPVTSGGTRPVYNAATGGRVATNSSVTAPTRGQVRQDDYYNRNWRSSRQGDTFGGSSSNYSQPSRSNQGGWNNNSQQTQWNNGRSSSGFDSGRSTNYGGGATRSSAPASSGSNGRSRGRD